MIKHNVKRLKKDLRSCSDFDFPISYRIFKNEYDEADYIIKEIKNLLSCGIAPGEIAILLRNNAQNKLYIKKFELNNLSCNIKDSKDEGGTDGVVISTIHASKGLEYEVVFIPQINENHIPFIKARHIRDIDEERRLFYVAMTRAKNRLYLSSDKKIHGRDCAVSLFIKEAKLELRGRTQVEYF